MKSEARKTVRTLIKHNSITLVFFMILVPVLLVVGLVVAFTDLVTSWKVLVETVIGVGLIWSIRGIIAVNANTPRLLRESAIVFSSVNNQIQLGWRLKK